MDMYAIGTALAGKYGEVTVGTAVMGGTAIRYATAETPNNVPTTPAVIVELPEGEIIQDPAQRKIRHDFPVFFLFAKASGDQPRDKKAMLRWLGPLLDAFEFGNKLGIAVIDKVLVMGFESVTYEYAGDEYHAWRLPTAVWTTDSHRVHVEAQ